MVSAMSNALSLPPPMTVAAFFAWMARQDGKWELVDGEPVAINPGSIAHALVHGECARLLGNHLAAASSRCRVLVEGGIVPRVGAATNYRIPDLVVTCGPQMDGESWVVSEPLLLVEILSPSNRRQTWSNVWSYTTIPSVQEILVLHTDAIRASLLRRQADMTWPEQPALLEGDDRLELASLGFNEALRAMYRTTAFG